jgi:hypothetical protein
MLTENLSKQLAQMLLVAKYYCTRSREITVSLKLFRRLLPSAQPYLVPTWALSTEDTPEECKLAYKLTITPNQVRLS